MYSNETLFTIDNLNVIYTIDNLKPNTIFQNLEQTFLKNYLYIILGENGSGKTTLIKSILGQLETTEMYSSYIKFNNHYLSAKQLIKKLKIGYIPQHPKEALIESFSIGENIAFRNQFRNKKSIQSWLTSFVYTKEEINKIKEFLLSYDFLNFLVDRLEESINNLSGGQQQLLNLAIVLYYQPNLVLMDEPTSKLDKEHKTKFWEHILRLHSENDNKTTYIITTHDNDITNFQKIDRHEKLIIQNQVLFNYS